MNIMVNEKLEETVPKLLVQNVVIFNIYPYPKSLK